MTSTHLTTHFIYRPKSGGRVLLEKQSPHAVIVLWNNGCRHVAGDVVLLAYEAAARGYHWRYLARRAACDIVGQTGGVAYDDRGTIVLIVPSVSAIGANRLMRSLAPRSPHEETEKQVNLTQLYRAGRARVGEGLQLEPDEVGAGSACVTWRQLNNNNIEVMSDGVVLIRSPWGIESVLGTPWVPQTQAPTSELSIPPPPTFSAPSVWGGRRSDGYDFWAVLYPDGLSIIAGCREIIGFEAAREHWRTTRGGTPLGDESLTLVDRLEELAREAGWV